MRKQLGLCLVLTLVFVSWPVAADEVMVHVGHNKLEPSELKVSVGTTVVFHNMDEMPGGHTIIAADGSFESPGLGKNESWSHTFNESGSYAYSIKEHPSAKGTVVVE